MRHQSIQYEVSNDKVEKVALRHPLLALLVISLYELLTDIGYRLC